MKKLLVVIFIVLGYSGCHSGNDKSNNSIANKTADSISKQKIIDSEMKAGERPDSEQLEPSFDEVKADLFKSYNQIKNTDTTIIDGKDSLTLHFKYYCLHDSSLIVPGRYIAWNGVEKKDYTVNNFVSKILIVKNKDTILNRTFLKKDFDKVIFEEERKYGIMFDADFQGYSKTKGEFLFGYTITIPMTDVGVPASITVNKMGIFTIHDEYFKTENFFK